MQTSWQQLCSPTCYEVQRVQHAGLQLLPLLEVEALVQHAAWWKLSASIALHQDKPVSKGTAHQRLELQ